MENLQPAIIDRVIEMAWEDRTSFEAIHYQFGLSEKEVIELMRKEMKSSSFRMWRKRIPGNGTNLVLFTADSEHVTESIIDIISINR